MPNGQWPACRREAYSSEMAVRAMVLGGISFGATVVEGMRDGTRERALDGLERSIVGEVTKLLSIFSES
jgi:hypothetical protein